MPLTCSCECDYECDCEPEPGQWEFNWLGHSGIDFEPYKKWISKRCVSCNELINYGNLCLEFPRSRHPYNEIESMITGADWDCLEEPTIRIPPVYQCEKCGEIFLNLQSVGFECISPSENMPELLFQYQIEYTPPKLTRAFAARKNEK